MADLILRIARMRSVRAVIDLGQRRADNGDVAGAAAAFQLAANSRAGRYDDVRGALHLWILQAGQGDMRAADKAYLLAVNLWTPAGRTPGRRESVADKSLRLGTGIAAHLREFVRPARAAFRRVIASGDPESVPFAAMGLAGLELQAAEEFPGPPDIPAIVAALRRAIDSGHPDFVPDAANWLAHTANQTGDVDMARIALHAAMDSGELDQGTHTALDAGDLFQRKGHRAEAIVATRFVFENCQDGRASIAARRLGELLAEEGDIEGAREAYQYVLGHSTFPHVIREIQAAMRRLE